MSTEVVAAAVSGGGGAPSETTRRRVKLYMLNEERQWDDKGTGHVSAMCLGASKNMGLVVISEADGSTLLESRILNDTAYQKQQETLIVWSETDNTDLALSFQEKAGCDEVWEKICNVQGKDPSVDITQEVVDDWEQTEEGDFDSATTVTGQLPPDILPAELPPCDLTHLSHLSGLLQSGREDIPRRESVVAALVSGDYLRQLMKVFHEAEEQRNRHALHILFEIIRMMIYYNKHCLIERLTADDLVFDVVGILEYDPAREPEKAQHRDFLWHRAVFNEIVPFNNDELTAKIHRTYRMQYILECCLPPCYIFEEHLVTLSSIIFFNKIEILTHVQNDAAFLRRLFNICESEESRERQLGAARLLKELCDLARMLQVDQREPFFKTLYAHGVFRAVAALLRRGGAPGLNALGADVVSLLTEFTPNTLREYQLKESEGAAAGDWSAAEGLAGGSTEGPPRLLLNMLVDVMHRDPDPELSTAMHITHTLRVLLDPENMTNNSLHGFRGERHEFLVFFYKVVIEHLLAPLFAVTTSEDKMTRDDYRSALMVQHLLEFLGHCIDTHTFHARTYILNNNILKRVCTLLRSKHLFLQLSAIRLLRRTLGVRDISYVRYMVRHRLLSSVINLFLRNGYRYNLVDSAILELFEHIRMEEVRPLINYMIEHHWGQLKDITYVRTFSELKKLHVKSMRHRFSAAPPTGAAMEDSDPEAGEERPQDSPERTPTRREPRQLDKEEENWFEEDEDEEEEEEEEEGEPEPDDGGSTPPVIEEEIESRSVDEVRPPPLRSSEEEEEEGEGSIFALSRTRRPAGSHPGPAAAPTPSSPPGLHPSPQRYALSRVSSGGGARKAPIVININLTKQRSCLPTEAAEPDAAEAQEEAEAEEEARGPSAKVEEPSDPSEALSLGVPEVSKSPGVRLGILDHEASPTEAESPAEADATAVLDTNATAGADAAVSRCPTSCSPLVTESPPVVNGTCDSPPLAATKRPLDRCEAEAPSPAKLARGEEGEEASPPLAQA